MPLCWVSLCWVLLFSYCYAECHYDEWRYAKCLYSECCGTQSFISWKGPSYFKLNRLELRHGRKIFDPKFFLRNIFANFVTQYFVSLFCNFVLTFFNKKMIFRRNFCGKKLKMKETKMLGQYHKTFFRCQRTPWAWAHCYKTFLSVIYEIS